MFRKRLVATPVNSESARELQSRLLAYHDFRYWKATQPLAEYQPALALWQSERLKTTHADLYRHPSYHHGLAFLLSDLYTPVADNRRDDDIDRVFPKMVKWLPDSLLDTFAGMVELNHLTQQLDLSLLEQLIENRADLDNLQPESYCAAFRAVGNVDSRERQISLIAQVGSQLNRYVKSRSVGWLLGMSRGPADMAGLEDLHAFLHRGYSAFQAMDRVDVLINEVVARERQVVAQILAGDQEPFSVSGRQRL
ncbi:MAG: hypothetical protein WD623_05850 [Marinobacter sp.]|uniref:FFLEELY motif protein n=1 Tax=Marinobacter sp. TaxID=50741 RepID=UPI0034A0A3D2